MEGLLLWSLNQSVSKKGRVIMPTPQVLNLKFKDQVQISEGAEVLIRCSRPQIILYSCFAIKLGVCFFQFTMHPYPPIVRKLISFQNYHPVKSNYFILTPTMIPALEYAL